MSILNNRTDKARSTEAPILFLIFLALVAAVNIVLFSVVSIPLLGASKENLTQSRSYNSRLEDKVIGALVSHLDSDASPVPAHTKSPSASNTDNMSSSTPVLPYFATLIEKTLAAPALKPTPNREASTTAVETSNGSTPAPSIGKTPPPEPSPSQEVRASPASMADAANPAQDALGATMPAPAFSHERDQLFQKLEKQRHHASLDEGSVAFAPEIDFLKETQIKESTGFYGSSAGPASKPPVRYAAPRGRGPVKADNIANKLNHAELRRLVQRSGGLQRSGVLR